ncbi:phage holin family protein [Amaricoccus sp. W119]|uniref:phage holin family protein n=1 Tax=Amaricoccus sp. W119 TaxID=3391833 RepID=UPI0039A7031F
MSMPEDRGATTLLADLVGQVTELFRKEIELLRAEIGETKNKATSALGFILVGAVLALTALNVLAAALVRAIEHAGLDAGWAALIVGGVLLVIALVLARKGMGDLKASEFAPRRTTRAVSRDAAMAKEKM